MTNIQQLATVFVMLVVVLAFVGLSIYEVVVNQNGDSTKLLLGALIAAFANISTHLFGQLNQAFNVLRNPPPPPANGVEAI